MLSVRQDATKEPVTHTQRIVSHGSWLGEENAGVADVGICAGGMRLGPAEAAECGIVGAHRSSDCRLPLGMRATTRCTGMHTDLSNDLPARPVLMWLENHARQCRSLYICIALRHS